MKIVIKKKAFDPEAQPVKGSCLECARWSHEAVAKEKLKRGLGQCLLHGCFTPKDGTCNGFVRK